MGTKRQVHRFQSWTSEGKEGAWLRDQWVSKQNPRDMERSIGAGFGNQWEKSPEFDSLEINRKGKKGQ